MSRERLIDKVRKCLALSKSSNEHEAAAALRQAQKLMALHDISEEDVGLSLYTSELVVTDYEFGKRKPLILVSITGLMHHALGVSAVWEIAPNGNHAIRYFGPIAAATLAAHAHTVVYRACGRAWREYLRNNPWVKGEQGARAGFFVGWCHTVKAKVEAIAPDSQKIGAKIEQHYGGSLHDAQIGSTTIYDETAQAGMRAGEDFDLHRPVGQDRVRLEKL